MSGFSYIENGANIALFLFIYTIIGLKSCPFKITSIKFGSAFDEERIMGKQQPR